MIITHVYNDIIHNDTTNNDDNDVHNTNRSIKE